MCQNKPEYISLTGENSHKLSVPIGQGSFSIGTKGISKRPIEDFHWSPQDAAFVDYTNAVIHNLFIDIGENKIEILIGDRVQSLTLSGNLENVHIKHCTKVPYLHFAPTFPIKVSQPYQLPFLILCKKRIMLKFLILRGARHLTVTVCFNFQTSHVLIWQVV